MSLIGDRRSLLDIVTGGKYKTSSDIPQMSTTGKVTPENLSWLYERFFPDKQYDVKGGPGFALEAVSPAGIIKKANTAKSLFQGWRDNLYAYASTLSKKQRKKSGIDGIIARAWDELSYAAETNDIPFVQGKLQSINKHEGFNKFVKVPDITTEGVAGGVLKQSKKVRGAPIQQQKRIVESPKRIEQRETTKKAKKEAKAGGEPRKRLVREY
jgi:hypothetical protein|tara:strand:+ start:495 stop:1130 length:636 start_codon:yes stop_codon:yes gene_type:complete